MDDVIDIDILNDTELKDLEPFICQFQKHTDKILSVKNGSIIKIFNKIKDLPKLNLLTKRRKWNVVEYIFFSEVDHYSFYGRQIALKINPQLDLIDKPYDDEINNGILEALSTTIIDNGTKNVFFDRNLIYKYIKIN